MSIQAARQVARCSNQLAELVRLRLLVAMLVVTSCLADLVQVQPANQLQRQVVAFELDRRFATDR